MILALGVCGIVQAVAPFDFLPALDYNAVRLLVGSLAGRRCLGTEKERGCKTLANTKSAIKRVRQNERKRRVNQVHRSRARTMVKRTRRLIAAGQFDEAEAMAQQAASALDRAAQKGIIHKNNASRRKSRLMQKLNEARSQQA